MRKKGKIADVRKKSAFYVIIRIIKDTRPIVCWMLLAMALSVASIILSMLAPELIGRLTDSIYEYCVKGAEIDTSGFISTAILLALAYAFSALLSISTMILMNNVVTGHFTCRIRVDMSSKISRIPIKTIDTTSNGDIISRMINDVSIMGGSVHDIFDIIINGVLKLLIVMVVIFVVNPLMALVVVIFVPFSIFLSARLAAKSEKYFNESRETAGRIYTVTEENLTGFETVKAFNLEKQRQVSYEELSYDYREKSKRGYLTSGRVQPIVVLVNNLAYITICVVGSLLSVGGRLGVGDLMAFILYTQLFQGPLESISWGLSMMQSTIASARRVYEFLDGDDMVDPPRQDRTRACSGNVDFVDVSFSYTDDKTLIDNLNLSVKAGQKVAIVGPTGAGKTTLVNLLMRFYDPNSGEIRIDGVDICSMNRADVRDMFSMVLQDSIIFSGTVYENIAYGNPDAGYDDVITAAKNANIDKWIASLPDGYDTVINEETANISGGQKQLLTIARAYLSDRPILILDEATSNVDTRTELIIQRTMDELMRDRTAFVIAHRLSTIENADVILVVDSGHIVESGTHRELIELGGLYSRIHASQYSVLKAK